MPGFVLKRCLTKASTRGSKNQKKNVRKDKISQLPDELVVTILSFLTVKEAARSSILSHRWRRVWTCIQTLNFDPSEVLPSLDTQLWDNYDPTLINARTRYVEWVNLVLKSYRPGSVLDELRVRFDLNADYTCHIDNWLRFAFENKVHNLTMHFATSFHGLRLGNFYSFPDPLVNVSSFRDCTSLQKLNLDHVSISQNIIEHLLSSCPNLQVLSIAHSNSQNLEHLNIVGQSLCLKHLNIVYCDNLKSLYLYAPNLSSFEYVGQDIDISYANVPNLVNLSVGCFYAIEFIYNFPRFSSFAMQLETLTLFPPYIKPNMSLVEYPEMPCLKNLKLIVYVTNETSVLVFGSLMNAAPLLCKVVLEQYWVPSTLKMTKLEKAVVNYAYPCLKEVEIVGFVGRKTDMEFAKHLLENANALEKVVLDTWAPGCAKCDMVPSLEVRERAMKMAMLLDTKFSPTGKLVLRNF